MPIVLKSGSLNLLETTGPVQACNGIALSLPQLPQQKEMAVPNVVFSTQSLLTDNYTNIKTKKLEDKHNIYFKDNVFRKT